MQSNQPLNWALWLGYISIKCCYSNWLYGWSDVVIINNICVSKGKQSACDRVKSTALFYNPEQGDILFILFKSVMTERNKRVSNIQ